MGCKAMEMKNQAHQTPLDITKRLSPLYEEVKAEITADELLEATSDEESKESQKKSKKKKNKNRKAKQNAKMEQNSDHPTQASYSEPQGALSVISDDVLPIKGQVESEKKMKLQQMSDFKEKRGSLTAK